MTLINISFITITAMVAKKKVSFEDFAPSKPLLGKAGELYPADCFLWTQRPDEDIVHDLNAAHNKATKKFLKGAKQKASDPEGANVNAERDVFIALLQFIAFGTTPAGSPIYPRLIDLEKKKHPQSDAATVKSTNPQVPPNRRAPPRQRGNARRRSQLTSKVFLLRSLLLFPDFRWTGKLSVYVAKDINSLS